MIDVRPAVVDDADAVWPLARDLATSYVVDQDTYATVFAGLLTEPMITLLVATDGEGAVVGYLLGQRHLTLHAGGPVLWVEEVMVDAARRGTGVGRALMEAAEDQARTTGAAYVALATRRAGDFYARLGYRESAAYLKKVLRDP